LGGRRERKKKSREAGGWEESSEGKRVSFSFFMRNRGEKGPYLFGGKGKERGGGEQL